MRRRPPTARLSEGKKSLSAYARVGFLAAAAPPRRAPPTCALISAVFCFVFCLLAAQNKRASERLAIAITPHVQSAIFEQLLTAVVVVVIAAKSGRAGERAIVMRVETTRRLAFFFASLVYSLSSTTAAQNASASPTTSSGHSRIGSQSGDGNTQNFLHKRKISLIRATSLTIASCCLCKMTRRAKCALIVDAAGDGRKEAVFSVQTADVAVASRRRRCCRRHGVFVGDNRRWRDSRLLVKTANRRSELSSGTRAQLTPLADRSILTTNRGQN